jgi:hypothetical protein
LPRPLKSSQKFASLEVNFTNVLRAAFLCLCFRFVLYWRKTVGTKAARRMLVKLTPGHTLFFSLSLSLTHSCTHGLENQSMCKYCAFFFVLPSPFTPFLIFWTTFLIAVYLHFIYTLLLLPITRWSLHYLKEICRLNLNIMKFFFATNSKKRISILLKSKKLQIHQYINQFSFHLAKSYQLKW